MTTALQAIAIKAQTHPTHRFQNLYKLMDKRLLFGSWGSLNVTIQLYHPEYLIDLE